MSQDEREAVELLPCPFCGGKELALSYVRAGVEWWAVDCNAETADGCGANIQRSTKAEAISAWNTRLTAKGRAMQ